MRLSNSDKTYKAELTTDLEHEVHVRLFGLVELENQWGRVTEKTSGPSLSWLLMKYLLVNPYREVGQEELTENLWPNKPDIKAEGASRVRLRRLREDLAPLHLDGRYGLVLFHTYIYRLNPEYTLQTDADAFLKLMTQIRNTPLNDSEGLNLYI